ncbi:response regulator transcription factor [Vallitalea okinawensis]|uniref:response regulator transcription factor n=1 Tax=Vallitalea okinawensis TaxID=2078660 RepID=UPI000CFBEDF4|nr:response regulator [Vallitalea okinawensis]
MNILVADDEKFIRRGIITILSKNYADNIKLFEARNGMEVLEIIQRHKIDLIISDIKMPKMTGIELIKALSKSSYRCEVIFVSGYEEFEYAKEAIKHGVRAYLLKPVKKNELIEEIDKINPFLKIEQNKYENIDKAIKYIEENYSDKNLSMSIVSNYVSLNYSYFSQLFKECTGVKFVDYLIKLRVNNAKDLLVHTAYKVYEIAEKVGYKDTKQFVKMFKLQVGMSPKEFRSHSLQ